MDGSDAQEDGDLVARLQAALDALGDPEEERLQVDEDGVCLIESTDGDEVTIQALPELDMVDVAVALLPLEDAAGDAPLREAMLLNAFPHLTGRSRVGLEPDGDMLVLRETLAGGDLDAASLDASLRAVMDLAPPIARHLAEGLSVEGLLSDDEARSASEDGVRV